MTNVTQKEMADARTDDRHYLMNQLQAQIMPINEKLDELKESSIRQDESIKNFEKRFEYHMEKEEKDRGEIVTNLKEILMKIDTKESKSNVWKYLGVFALIFLFIAGYFFNRDEVQDKDIKELRSNIQNINETTQKIQWNLENRFK